jgi:Methyltransferase domain
MQQGVYPLISCHGTVLFFDKEARRLRHGQPGNVPQNLLINILEDRCRLLHIDIVSGQSHQLQIISQQGHVKMSNEHPEDFDLDVLTISDNVIGLSFGENFLSSDSDGVVRNDRGHCREWEHYWPAILPPGAANLLRASHERRVITVDYAYQPQKRKYEDTVGGRRVTSLLGAHSDKYCSILRDIASFRDAFRGIEVSESENVQEPYWRNGWLPGLDGAAIYTLIRKLKPRTYFEVGSGNSTKFARRAIKDGGLSTRIISVDPQPRAEINNLCDEVIRKRFEDLEEEAYVSRLAGGDIVFVDNSHRSFQSSDVTVFFTEMLPALPVGTVWGLHDILLPQDYPEHWLNRFYNEQYLLAAYLLGGHVNDEIIFPASFVSSNTDLSVLINDLFSHPHFKNVERHGVAFWMRRKG